MVDCGLGLLENYGRMLEVFVRDWFLDLPELKFSFHAGQANSRTSSKSTTAHSANYTTTKYSPQNTP